MNAYGTSFETAVKTVRNVCPLCPERDGILLTVENEKIVFIEGDSENSFTAGHICIKGLNSNDALEHPDRVVFPLLGTMIYPAT